MNVLIVDDDPQSVLTIQGVLNVRGYQTFSVGTATDAQVAIECVRASVVILDADLSDMSGADLCRWVRQTFSYRYIYLLIVSNKSDPEAALHMLDAGADDIMDRSVLREELSIRIGSAERIMALEKELERKNRHLNTMFKRLTGEFMQVANDMTVASRVQQDLLPAAATFDTVEAYGFLRPAQFMAGDSYDYFKLDDEHLAFYIADVVGHGSTSAMVSYALHHQITPRAHSLCINNLSASESLEEAVISTVVDLNEQFCVDGEHNRWFTMIYGLIELSNGRVTMCQAGQPPALHCSMLDSRIELIGAGGFPVGLFDDVKYTASHCQMNPGDKLVVHSDGALECLSEKDVEYGYTQLDKVLLGCVNDGLPETAKAINDSLVLWNGNKPFADDVSILLFQYAA